MSSDIRPLNVTDKAPRTREPRRIVVIVRHSPFPLKKATVEAVDEADAKAKFIELARALNEKKCQQVQEHQEAGDVQRAIRARRESFQRAIDADNRNELVWSFVDEKKHDELRQKMKARTARVWGDPERLAV